MAHKLWDREWFFHYIVKKILISLKEKKLETIFRFIKTKRPKAKRYPEVFWFPSEVNTIRTKSTTVNYKL